MQFDSDVDILQAHFGLALDEPTYMTICAVVCPQIVRMTFPRFGKAHKMRNHISEPCQFEVRPSPKRIGCDSHDVLICW
jgi:hypothetical protein